MEKENQATILQYQKDVKTITPTHNTFVQMLKAFLMGGLICTIGQILLEVGKYYGLNEENASTFCSLTLILLAVLLTGFNIFPTLAKWGGAGILVPICGFANSVCAPAIEFKKEGQVFGIGCKIFSIAGPVILYGILTSWLLGLIYWIASCFGIILF